jgi:putative FmdB family regulatory protein
MEETTVPIYEYTCDKCDSQFELLVRGGERPACPSCGGRKLEKLLSVPAAHVNSSCTLPVREAPRGGGCGLPECGTGGCGME